MAKTLLNSLNEVAKRANVIAGDAAAFTSLTDSGRQHAIDVIVQVVNEGVDELYSFAGQSKPNQQAESTLVLVNGTQDYTLATDLIQVHFPMIDRVNTQFLFMYPGGYDDMLLLDPEQNDTGLPYYAAINPINGKLHMDRKPTAVEAGRTYTYEYEKNLIMALATDTVPFSDVVFRAMVPVWMQLYKREMRNEFDNALYKQGLGRAGRYLSEIEPRSSYSPR